MKPRTALAIILSLSSLGGCSTLSKSECNSAQWQKIGFEDGSQGQLASYVDKHQQACEQYQIEVDAGAYSTGRNEGLKSYCTPKNAYAQGLAGDEYGGVCPEQIASNFQQAYVQGLKVRLEVLYSELNRLDFDRSLRQLHRFPHRHNRPNKSPHHHRRSWRERDAFAMQNRYRRMLSERATIERRIRYWSSS